MHSCNRKLHHHCSDELDIMITLRLLSDVLYDYIISLFVYKLYQKPVMYTSESLSDHYKGFLFHAYMPPRHVASRG